MQGRARSRSRLGANSCQLGQEIAQEGGARDGQDRFGVELHAFDGQLTMAQSHDDPVVEVAVTISSSGSESGSTTSEW